MPKRKIGEPVNNIKYSTKKTKKVLIDELNELKQKLVDKEKDYTKVDNTVEDDDQIISAEDFGKKIIAANSLSPSMTAYVNNLKTSLIAIDRNRTMLLNSLRSLLNITNSIFLESTSPKRDRKAILSDKYTIPLKNLIGSIESKIKIVPIIKPSLLKKDIISNAQ